LSGFPLAPHPPPCPLPFPSVEPPATITGINDPNIINFGALYKVFL